MNLLVTTPTAVVLRASDVQQVRAEDASGSFGIRQGHADFLTVLEVSVLGWIGAEGHERFVAVRGGVLRVRNGTEVSVAAREAVAGESLGELKSVVLERFRKVARDDEAARISTARLHLATMRQLQRYLGAGSEGYPGTQPGGEGGAA